jgi:hypothetical protein
MSTRSVRLAAALSAGLVLLSGAMLAQAAGVSATIKTGSYTGMTSEKEPVTFKISHREIRSFSTVDGYNGTCGQGGGPGFTIKPGAIKIKANGRFSAKVTLVGPVATVANHKGSLTGKVSGGKVTGSIKDLTLAQGTGCKTGYNETFSARKV